MTEITRPVNLARAAEVLALCGIQYEVDPGGNLCFWLPAAEEDPVDIAIAQSQRSAVG